MFGIFGKEQLTPRGVGTIVEFTDLKNFMVSLSEIPGLRHAQEVMEKTLLPLFVHNFPRELGSLLPVLELAKQHGLHLMENLFPEDKSAYDIYEELGYATKCFDYGFPASKLLELMLPLLRAEENCRTN